MTWLVILPMRSMRYILMLAVTDFCSAIDPTTPPQAAIAAAGSGYISAG